MLWCVGGRFEVGHGADGGKSTGTGCLGTSGNRLFVLKSRFAEMHMHICQPGKQCQPAGIDYLHILFRQYVGCHADYTRATDQNIRFADTFGSVHIRPLYECSIFHQLFVPC